MLAFITWSLCDRGKLDSFIVLTRHGLACLRRVLIFFFSSSAAVPCLGLATVGTSSRRSSERTMGRFPL